MPRQLPWLNRGGGSRTQVKQPPKPPPKPSVPRDTDDDFFEGTAFASSRRGQERAASQESDDDLPEVSDDRGRISRKGKEAVERSRMPSSSPPPLSATLSPPETEPMRKGVDKFDLRDDEWMMVEDELLQTAKLFTRHLHLAEYERMKAEMEERAKVAAARPFVPDVQLSDEGRFKKKAEQQVKIQKKALKDFFPGGGNVDQGDERLKSRHANLQSTTSTTSKNRSVLSFQRLRDNSNSASDSDDLDAPRRPKKHTVIIEKGEAVNAKIDAKPTASEFVKPALPLNARERSKLRRPTPFDMWDEIVPDRSSKAPPEPAPTTTSRPPSTPKARSSTHTSTSSSTPSAILPSPRQKPPARSLDLFSGLDPPKRDKLPITTPGRLTKRKGEKESDLPSKSSKTIDDIPIFLF